MKSVVLLIGSRVLNGLIGLFLFLLLKQLIMDNGYNNFSSSLATLILLTTFSGGILGGLLLKNAFYFGSSYQQVIYFYTLLFALFIIISVEIAFSIRLIEFVSRASVYAYLISHLLSTLAMIHYQLKQQFVKMSTIEIARNLIPLLLVLGLLSFGEQRLLSIDQVIYLIALGNLLGLVYLIQCINIPYQGTSTNLKSYLAAKLKSDLQFGFSFGSFNAIAQSVIVMDRNQIASQIDQNRMKDVAYTADQVTKVNNGILFPLNTKVSGQVGHFVRAGEGEKVYTQLSRYAMLSLVIGLLLNGLALIFVYAFSNFTLLKDIDPMALVYYGLANTIYLACLIFQKRFDYTKYKILPTLTLLMGGLMAYGLHSFYTSVSYFFLTVLCYSLLLLAASMILPSKQLVLDK